MEKIKWGIMGAATIAMEQVIPAMLKSEFCEVFAIASRGIAKAEKAAGEFKIPKFYGSYEDLLGDKEIEAVYIPLPNHLHVEWAIKAMNAGKHVLVEKPIALSSEQAQYLLKEAERHPELKIMEAFMYKFHPQWIKAKELIDQGAIGPLKTIQSSFSFFDDDPKSIVNKKDFGGGSLMDIGCYPISISRFLFDAEPESVVASITYDPDTKVDILASGILEFNQGNSTFFSAIQLFEGQQVRLFGPQGSIAFEIPFNPPPDQVVKLSVFKEEEEKSISFDICDQYTLQVDAFSKAVRNGTTVPFGIDDAVKNMIVIEKLRESHDLGKRVSL
ncbi:Gfo/Idh/MocA family oxidoreductase [uncultured Kriegella sp.]|uniref:Gfo/Idh/MocA family protein n=1 Tax=uncultured Kriegella sp. TaxID=1798910 RepID=UPI0030DD4821|tara:strand:+ start:24517 stop:25506 length:990 start_codon:yes stop_codon:yes gene_type:complete